MSAPRLPPGVEKALRDRDDGEPHRLTGFSFMGVYLQGGLNPREVPQEFWDFAEANGATVAAVRCPCGVADDVPLGEHPTKCDCGRWYFFDGTDVLSLVPPPVTPSA